ncbi:YpoC family protein [Neobacillus dielmonensis]|uniref:YpoC family protein n=1 Tax=Neobacillus dielmonensis TaxID=1347369 RepID=UPI0006941412|nr:hypothetical protein [Neobacillus dielmonensis]
MINRDETAAKRILKEWADMKHNLERLFRERDFKNVDAMMKQGIGLFIRFLYITNGQDDQPASRQPIPYQEFSVIPINLEERLEFVRNRPNLFHSYRQLSELMVELEKLFVIENIKKSSRTNS